jgi:outer membrane protein
MKILMKAALAATAFVPGMAMAQALPGAIIAVVDTQRIYVECTACKAALSQIQALGNQAQQRSQALSTPLQTESQALQTEANRVRSLPAGAARSAAEKALETRAQSFQTKQQTAQRELQGLEDNIRLVQANVSRQINEKLNPIISQVMQQRGANIAVDQQATLAAAKSVDVTDGVLAALNAQLPSVSVTPLPQQAQPPRPTTPSGR